MISQHAIHPYPTDFPCFSRDSYAMELDMGLTRVESEVLVNRQKRSYTNLPTMISASVVIPVPRLYDFTVWLNTNIGLWIDLPLAHPFMDRNNQVERVPARILDFTFSQGYQLFGNVAATFTIQLSPTVFIDNANRPDDEWEWVIGGSETYPSPDWVIAGKVKSHATDWIVAGKATNPGGP